MRKIAFILAAAAVVGACTAKESLPEHPGDALISLSLSTGGGEKTKSILPEGSSFDNAIHNVLFVIIDSEGDVKSKYISSYGSGSSSAVESVFVGRSCTVYALVNMGNVLEDLPRSGGVPLMEEYRYEIPSFEGLSDAGIPMAGKLEILSGTLPAGVKTPVQVGVRRLMAKVNVHIDKSSITGGESIHLMRSQQVSVLGAAKALYPFMDGGSRVMTDGDRFSSLTDYYSFTETEEWGLLSDTVFYVPENIQGDLFSTATREQDKVPVNMDDPHDPSFCTYLEFTARKDGSEDGVGGGITYRSYLGEDNLSNCSVTGNRVYNATLHLSWEGFRDEDGWRIELQDDWEDKRRLDLLSYPDVQLVPGENFSNAVQFWRVWDGTTGPLVGDTRVGCYTYPFGWNFSLNGQEAALDTTSGTFPDGTAFTTSAPSSVGIPFGIQIATVEDEDLIGQDWPFRIFTWDRAIVKERVIHYVAPTISCTQNTFTWTYSQCGSSATRGATLSINFSASKVSATCNNSNVQLTKSSSTSSSVTYTFYWLSTNTTEQTREAVITVTGPLGASLQLYLYQSPQAGFIIDDPGDGGEGNNDY